MYAKFIEMTSLTYSKCFLSHWHDHNTVVFLVDPSWSSELSEIYCIVIVKSTSDGTHFHYGQLSVWV